MSDNLFIEVLINNVPTVFNFKEVYNVAYSEGGCNLYTNQAGRQYTTTPYEEVMTALGVIRPQKSETTQHVLDREGDLLTRQAEEAVDATSEPAPVPSGGGVELRTMSVPMSGNLQANF